MPTLNRYANALTAMHDMHSVNLADFTLHGPSSDGTLEISGGAALKSTVYIEIGRDILELSKIAPPEAPRAKDLPMGDYIEWLNNESEKFAQAGGYIIRNLRADKPEAAVLLGGANIHAGDTELNGTELSLYTGQRITLGRRSTPELELTRTAEEEHVFIRSGALQANLRFTDLDTEIGTRIYLDNAKDICSKNRTFYTIRNAGDSIMTREAVQGHWSRSPRQSEF